MDPSDQLATSFITLFGAFCYTSMLFGLRNARAIFGRNLEVYIDDIVKSRAAT